MLAPRLRAYPTLFDVWLRVSLLRLNNLIGESRCHEIGAADLIQESRPRAVFLDRDGTLIRDFVIEGIARPPWRLEDLELLPNVVEALTELKSAGFLLVVITNQPDVARGVLARSTLDEINAALRARLPMLDDLECCCHDDVDQCDCRKPGAGMLQRAAARHGVDLQQSFVIGDSWRDTGAAEQAGCTSVQISRDPELARGHKASPDYWAPDILAASKLVIELSHQCSQH